MNFQHLKYFLAVAQEMNITHAADRLYISQQSLSNHIANLERELEVKLFTRSPKLSLTYAGTQLVSTATQILDLHAQYLNQVGDINRNYVGTLRVGISYTCGLALLPDILPKFQAEFPLVELSLFEGNSSELEEELSRSRVDLIICFQPIMMEGVEIVPLVDDKLVVAVPQKFTNQLFGDQAEVQREVLSQNFSLDPFRDQPFVLLKRGNRVRSILDQYFAKNRFKPNIALETENTITTLAMARSNVGIIVCPQLFLRDSDVVSGRPLNDQVDLFPLSDPETISRLVLGYRRDWYLSHFAERFIQIVQEVVQE